MESRVFLNNSSFPVFFSALFHFLSLPRPQLLPMATTGASTPPHYLNSLHQSKAAKLNIASIRSTISTINLHLQLLLSDSSALQLLQQQIAYRLSSSTKNHHNSPFSDHSVLSNLFWGVDNLHSAASSDDDGVRLSRLSTAERMLQVPALVDENGTTAGVDNQYLVCCSYFYLSLLRKLQGDDWQVAMHFLQALLVSPGYVRAEFAPELCQRLWEESRRWKRNEGKEDEEEIDEVMRRHGRRCKDWLMYYQVVSYGETPRWIKGNPVVVSTSDAIDWSTRRVQTSLNKKFESTKSSCLRQQDHARVPHEDTTIWSQYVPENKVVDKITGDKLSIAKLLELQNLDELEEESLFRRLDEVYYQDTNGNFDIKRLQEILEDSESDTTDSFDSEIDSTEGSDTEDNTCRTMTLSTHDGLSSCTVCGRNLLEEQPTSSHQCIDTNTAESPRHSMHIQACSLKTGYLISSKQHSSVSDATFSVLNIKDVHPYPSYGCYLEYTTPTGRSPAHDFGRFLPSNLLRRYGFSELVPCGSLARRKLDFSSFTEDWSEEILNNENKTQFEFVGRLEKAISNLCFSGGLGKCKDTSLEVKTVWEMLHSMSGAEYSTLRQQILFQLLDIVKTSEEEKLIRASLSILMLMISEDTSVLEEIKKKDSYLLCLARALKTNAHEAAILIHMLKPSPLEVKELEIVPILVDMVCSPHSQKYVSASHLLSPIAASLSIIEKSLSSLDAMTNNMRLEAIISPQILDKLVNIAWHNNIEEGIALAGLLVRCMRLDRNCRRLLSKITPIDPFLQLLKRNDKRAKFAALEYFHEILRMPRSSATALLQQIRQQGGINILHTLFACIQQAQQEHKLLAANLLLQLDMLEDSCGKSIFKDEALEVLMEAITSENNSSIKTLSAFIISNIGGTYAWSGEPYMAAWLVKKAGLTSMYNRHMIRNIDWQDSCLQESELDAWSSKIAKGLLKMASSIFDTLAVGIESNIKSVSRDSLVMVAWLGSEMTSIGANYLRYSVCEIILGGVQRFLHPGSELDERVMACLCIYNFVSGKGMQKLMNFSEGARESLRRLSGVTWMAEELLKVTDYFIPTKPRVSCVHTQILEAGKLGSGAVTALIYYKGQLYGGYTDGSIKVWDIKGQISKFVYEVKGHKKPVTCLTLFEPGDHLISGSLDKTLRIWQMSQKKFVCLETIEVKEQVHKISTYIDRIFVITHGRGVKVFRASKLSKTVYKSKSVKCLALSQSRMYLGCADSSIQGFDVMDNQEQEIRTPSNIWLLQNKPVTAIHVYKDWLYSAGANVEELNIKDSRRHNKPKIPIVLDKFSSVLEMAVVEDFIYLNCSSSPSILQIWLRGKQQMVGRLSAGSKITSLLTRNDIILCGTETGMIKGWIPL